MSVRENTKYLFAEKLKEMLKNCSLYEVHIKDLCLLCGAERQTFYYHFKDKYDLIAWIYLKDLERSIKEAEGYFCEKQLIYFLNIVADNVAFYRKAFDDTSQNSLVNYIREVNIEVTKNILKKMLKLEELSEEYVFSINYNSYAWIGSIIDWIKLIGIIPVEKYAHMMYMNTSILSESIIGADEYISMRE